VQLAEIGRRQQLTDRAPGTPPCSDFIYPERTVFFAPSEPGRRRSTSPGRGGTLARSLGHLASKCRHRPLRPRRRRGRGERASLTAPGAGRMDRPRRRCPCYAGIGIAPMMPIFGLCRPARWLQFTRLACGRCRHSPRLAIHRSLSDRRTRRRAGVEPSSADSWPTPSRRQVLTGRWPLTCTPRRFRVSSRERTGPMFAWSASTCTGCG
jgi:hypothetical protein